MKTLAVAISIVGGLAGSIQVAVMGKFGERIGVVEALAFAAVLSALLSATTLGVARQGVGNLGDAFSQPRWLWLGGVLGTFVVFAITLAAPRIGTFATIGIFIAGQLAMGAVIDRFGLFGLDEIPLRWPRVTGLVLLAVGAALTLKK